MAGTARAAAAMKATLKRILERSGAGCESVGERAGEKLADLALDFLYCAPGRADSRGRGTAKDRLGVMTASESKLPD